MENPNFDDLFQNFQICLFNSNDDDQNANVEMILQLIIESNFLIFDEYQESDEHYLIICFDNIILIINQVDINFLTDFLINNKKSSILYFSDNIKNLIQTKICCDFPKLQLIDKKNPYFKKINEHMDMNEPTNDDVQTFWKIIRSSLAYYLFRDAFRGSVFDRYTYVKSLYDFNFPNFHLQNNEYIELSDISKGSSATAILIYHIKSHVLLVLKVPYKEVGDELIEREKNNYIKMNHPFIPKYYGTADYFDSKGIAIEYIRGKTLDKYDLNKLNDDEKIKIFFEVLNTICYLHSIGFIYRDLKPNNIIIDAYKTAVLIDYDRMISPKDYDKTMTIDFASPYIAPEIPKEHPFTYKSDFYSLGKLLYFIFTGKDPNEKDNHFIFPNSITNYKYIQLLYDIFTREKPEERLKSHDVYRSFTYFFYDQLIKNYTKKLKKYMTFFTCCSAHNDPFSHFILGKLYYEGKYIKTDINSSIKYLKKASNCNMSNAQFLLGIIYYDEKYVPRNIKNTIYYFQLAAKLNNSMARFHLGMFYYEGKIVSKDIKKAIDYLTQPTICEMKEAYYFLGRIYYEGDGVSTDINKSIKYLKLASDKNMAAAQVFLGNIYYEGKKTPKDIKNALHYLELAANQNNKDDQYCLGIIYYQDSEVKQNMNKAIAYLTLAANQNHPGAQLILSNIYSQGSSIQQNTSKSFHFLNMTANNNNTLPLVISDEMKQLVSSLPKKHYEIVKSVMKNPNWMQVISLLCQGLMYMEGDNVQKDINKAIECFTKAANMGDVCSQNLLGGIYLKGVGVPVDVIKAKYYLELAAKQNDSNAHFSLSKIYLDKNFNSLNINEGLNHLKIAANNNDKFAQFDLGICYYKGKYVEQNIHSAIHYFALAAENKLPDAQHYLGLIYYNGKYIKPNYNESIYYFKLAAEQNFTESSYFLGYIYYEGKYTARDIKQSIYYFKKAADAGQYDCQFYLGVILSENKYNDINIDESIHYYKKASSNNNNFAKNNLGVIYKNGLWGVKNNTNYAIELFQEAIKQEKDPVSMYNLAHTYFYGPNVNIDIEKSINLLVQSIKGNFSPAKHFLCIVLIQKYENITEIDIQNELEQHGNNDDKLLNELIRYINRAQLTNKKIYYIFYYLYKKRDFMYTFQKKAIESMIFQSPHKYRKDVSLRNDVKEINGLFYEGFELDLARLYS